MAAPKHLKTTIAQLREVFDQSITVRCITEFDLLSAQNSELGSAVRQRMEDHDVDIIPVYDSDKKFTGFVSRDILKDGPCSEQTQRIEAGHLVAESTPILELFKMFDSVPWRFVLDRGDVSGIVTQGDLRKAPVRMYLFSLINLFEMQLGRTIRLRFPEEMWRRELSLGRITPAERLLEQRKKRNEALDLLECLQFCDKGDIIVRDETLRGVLGVSSKREGKKFFGRAQKLRDRIAHAQDLIEGSTWPELFDLSLTLEDFLGKLENFKYASDADDGRGE